MITIYSFAKYTLEMQSFEIPSWEKWLLHFREWLLYIKAIIHTFHMFKTMSIGGKIIPQKIFRSFWNIFGRVCTYMCLLRLVKITSRERTKKFINLSMKLRHVSPMLLAFSIFRKHATSYKRIIVIYILS